MSGGKFLVGSLPVRSPDRGAERFLSPPLGDYVAMFILSDCVRYKRDLWGEVVQGKATGILGVLELFIEVSRRRFPNLVFDKIFGEHFDYGAPGRIS